MSYIFEQGGEFHIPKEKIIWWNPESKELIELIVPEISWRVRRRKERICDNQLWLV